MVAHIGEGIKIRIIDTPGWEYVEEEIEQNGDEDRFDQLEERLAADVLRRNLGRVDRVKDVLPIGGKPFEGYNMSDGLTEASYVVKHSNAQDLMLSYNVPFFAEGDVEGFLQSLARAGGRVRKVRLKISSIYQLLLTGCSTVNLTSGPQPESSYVIGPTTVFPITPSRRFPRRSLMLPTDRICRLCWRNVRDERKCGGTTPRG